MKTKVFKALTVFAVLTSIGCGTASAKTVTQEMIPVTTGNRNSETIVDVTNVSFVSGRHGTGNTDCPNNGVCLNDRKCVNNGECLNNGVCIHAGECPNDGTCTNNGVCVNGTGNQVRKGHGNGRHHTE